MSIIIHAPNVHYGGGRKLLYDLIASIQESDNIKLVLDARMTIPDHMPDEVVVKKTYPTIYHRLKAEYWLAKHAGEDDVVISFGNLPPLFKLKSYTYCFVQNRYLTDSKDISFFPFKTRLRIRLERLWFSGRSGNIDQYIVQTQSMKNAVTAKLKPEVKVSIAPFATLVSSGSVSLKNKQEHKNLQEVVFIYVASGEPHKNHKRLIEAWSVLANDGIFPTLYLTVDEKTTQGYALIKEMIDRYKLDVRNVGQLTHDEMDEFYTKATALVYPSKFESFGLPLLEAKSAGLPVLAPELDYVRDLLNPEQTFNPDSAISIARAVKRFLGIKEEPLKIMDAQTFLEKLGKKQL